MAASEVSKRDSSVPPVTASSEKTKESGPAGPALSNDGQAASKVVPAVSLKEVKGLLAKHTCIACHNADKRQVGTAYKDIAKRKYSNEKIVEMIHTPKPGNRPDLDTKMHTMSRTKAS